MFRVQVLLNLSCLVEQLIFPYFQSVLSWYSNKLAGLISMSLRPYKYILFFMRRNYFTENFCYILIDSGPNLAQTITAKVIPNLTQTITPKVIPNLTHNLKNVRMNIKPIAILNLNPIVNKY